MVDGIGFGDHTPAVAGRWVLAGTMEAEETWRRLMGKSDMPKLVAVLRRLDLVHAAPA